MSERNERGEAAVSDPVRVERDGDLAVVTVDSPPLNLFDEALARGLEEAVAELESPRTRAVLFRAEGRAFSGGVDVSVFASLAGSGPARALFERLIELARRVERLQCPTVFAAHALCLTWAFELALACDLDRGDRIREVRARRGSNRPHSRHGRDAEAGRAGRQR